MTGVGRIHDRDLLDALEKRGATSFADDVWRVTVNGRDPLRGSAAGGRWSPPGTFEVLYTSLARTGALAEAGYRLSLEPVWPSRITHEIHTIGALAERTLHLADLSALAALGVDVARYSGFDYARTQAIAAAAHFLDFEGMIVPSARADCHNLVLFTETLAGTLTLRETAAVDWADWRRSARSR